jgi:hypothetical protein
MKSFCSIILVLLLTYTSSIRLRQNVFNFNNRALNSNSFTVNNGDEFTISFNVSAGTIYRYKLLDYDSNNFAVVETDNSYCNIQYIDPPVDEDGEPLVGYQVPCTIILKALGPVVQSNLKVTLAKYPQSSTLTPQITIKLTVN